MSRLPLRLRYMLKKQVMNSLTEAPEGAGDVEPTEESNPIDAEVEAIEGSIDAAQTAAKFLSAIMKAKKDFDEKATEQQRETIDQKFDFESLKTVLRSMLPPDSYSGMRPSAGIKSGAGKNLPTKVEKDELLK